MNKRHILTLLSIGLLLVSCNSPVDSLTSSSGNSSVSSSLSSSSDSIVSSEAPSSASTVSSEASSSLPASSEETLSSEVVSSSSSSSEEENPHPKYTPITSWPAQQIATFLDQPEDQLVPAFVSDKYYYKEDIDYFKEKEIQIIIDSTSETNLSDYGDVLKKAGFSLYTLSDNLKSGAYNNDYYFVNLIVTTTFFKIKIMALDTFMGSPNGEISSVFPNAKIKEDLELSYDLPVANFEKPKKYYYVDTTAVGVEEAEVKFLYATSEEIVNYVNSYKDLGFTIEITDEDGLYEAKARLDDFKIDLTYDHDTTYTTILFDQRIPQVFTDIDEFDMTIINDTLHTATSFSVTSVLSSCKISYSIYCYEYGNTFVEYLFRDVNHEKDAEFYKALCDEEAAELIKEGYTLNSTSKPGWHFFRDKRNQLYIQLTSDELGVHYFFH